jgi:hypothetical protein
VFTTSDCLIKIRNRENLFCGILTFVPSRARAAVTSGGSDFACLPSSRPASERVVGNDSPIRQEKGGVRLWALPPPDPAAGMSLSAGLRRGRCGEDERRAAFNTAESLCYETAGP